MIARAAFEGVVCGLLDGLDAISSVGVPTTADRFLLIGDGAKSLAYRRLLANLANREVTIPSNAEIVATGAAVQAAIMLGSNRLDDVAAQWDLLSGSQVEPNGDAEEVVLVRRRYAQIRG
jgi:xylulokinase